MLSRPTHAGAAPPAKPAGAAVSPESLRLHPRVPFVGCPFKLLAGGRSCSIRMRDLSCGGASGLCEEPLNVGDTVTICLAKEHYIEAEVRWVRLMNVGLKFTQPLAPGLVRRLHQTHGTFVTTRSKR